MKMRTVQMICILREKAGKTIKTLPKNALLCFKVISRKNLNEYLRQHPLLKRNKGLQ